MHVNEEQGCKEQGCNCQGCYGKELEPSAELQIAQMYKHSDTMGVASIYIQQQNSGSNNCGLFAIAAAYNCKETIWITTSS